MKEHKKGLEFYSKAVKENSDKLGEIIDNLKEEKVVLLRPLDCITLLLSHESRDTHITEGIVFEVIDLPSREYRIVHDSDFNSYLESVLFMHFTPKFHMEKIYSMIKEYNETQNPNHRFFVSRRNVMIQNYHIENHTEKYRVLAVASRTALPFHRYLYGSRNI